MAKNVSFSHLTMLFQHSCPRVAPFSICRRNDNGMAAPMENRKNGKIRSTHVMP